MMQERMRRYREAVEAYLNRTFLEQLPQKTLFEAMRYSLLAGGKRIRPIVTLEFCRACGGDWQRALPAAAALEMIHTYSLIHDDLPCMDNDDFRRGKPTNHKVYGESTAVLAGDGLLTAAFETAASVKDVDTAALISVLSRCAGPYGMVGGQQLDLEAEHRSCSEEEILEIYRLKTGALLAAGCEMGVICAGGSAAQREAARTYAQCVGLAFQLRDDILDVVGDSKKLGKRTGMDANKNTLVKQRGLAYCEDRIAAQTEQAVSALAQFPQENFLKELAHALAGRDY